jgi:tRNA threonylcarbamoyl adenosine modification protein (Sua5/YciO/YrdC/YwlC family)
MYLAIHPVNPQPRLIAQAAQVLRGGGIVVYPTDSCYALGCHIGDKDAMTRLRRIRGVDESHHFTLMCRDLKDIAHYAKVDNVQYRWLKAGTPGAYTFILEASREVPRRLAHPKRKTIGLRVPENPVAHALLAEMDEPVLSTTLILPDDDLPLNDIDDIRERLEHAVDAVIDGGPCGIDPTTVIDLTTNEPRLIRAGRGDPALFGFAREAA